MTGASDGDISDGVGLPPAGSVFVVPFIEG
jgi:hypothetical protein